MNTNLLDLNNEILNVIGDYVKKDNHDRMIKVCKQYAKLYEKIDTHKESGGRFNLNDEERVEYTIIYHENYKNFEKLQDLIKKIYLLYLN